MHAAGRVVAKSSTPIAACLSGPHHGRNRPDHRGRWSAMHGATSATIGYRGYQHASCISVNHVVCHGIPGRKR
jgi:methionyl aminopeptidase